MGKPTGFMEYSRKDCESLKASERIENYKEFHKELSPAERREQSARCMNCGVPFCQSGILIKNMVSGCPLNNLIPEWNDLLYRDNLKMALSRLMLTNPFPEFTGRVCPAPCESACTVSLNSPAVTIKDNERYIIEKGFEENLIEDIKEIERTDKRIAIIGSGPAGLTAAHYLNRFGHYVTVFERDDKVGGLLMYGIPNMKLDKSIIDRRISLMIKEGIDFKTNENIGSNEAGVKVEELFEEYDAVILATGASKARVLNNKLNNELKGIELAIDYLKANTKNILNKENKLTINAENKNVLIVGGGDTGTDCVATAVRQGCKKVIQIEITKEPPIDRGADNPWPEWKRTKKVDYGHQEYIERFGYDPRVFSTIVKEVIGDENGNISKVVLIKVDDKFNEIINTEEIVNIDLLLVAMGFVGVEDYVIESFNGSRSDRGNFISNRENLFVAGDANIGPSLVVRAIKEGIDIAYKVNGFLGGNIYEK